MNFKKVSGVVIAIAAVASMAITSFAMVSEADVPEVEVPVAEDSSYSADEADGVAIAPLSATCWENGHNYAVYSTQTVVLSHKRYSGVCRVTTKSTRTYKCRNCSSTYSQSGGIGSSRCTDHN